MTRAQLEHVIRAAAAIADDTEIIVVGSQSILGPFPDAPSELLVSAEADVFPKNRRDRWDVIDGAIGEGSPFHDTFGYYAQGVGEETATLPEGWKQRLVAVRSTLSPGVTGWCLDVHDLLIAKYVADREKDREFTRAAARYGLALRATLLERLSATALDTVRRDLVRARVAADYAATSSP